MRIAALRRALGMAPTRPTQESTGWIGPVVERLREYPETLRPAFHALGYNRRRPFFPHAVRCLPKAGPDGFRLASWMHRTPHPDSLWQVVVHATSPALEQVPPELFEDDDLLWHRQHLGLSGHVAYACLTMDGRDAYCTTLVSDLAQRIGRRREHKTQVNTLFRGWAHVLWNAIMALAVERNLVRVFAPRAATVMRHTDPDRLVQPELFTRVYDASPQERFVVRPAGDWWSVDVAANRSRVVLPRMIERSRLREKTICIVHDIERGLGHATSDPDLARWASEHGDSQLDAMLRIEQRVGVRATYAVVGRLFPEVRTRIEAGGHALAFHSFDHGYDRRQLARCRGIDYRVAGYRPPQSWLTRELRDPTLCLHNIEWLATSVHVLGLSVPTLQHRVVKIPILFDDYPMYATGTSYEEWERQMLDTIARCNFVAFGLHDCYAPLWLPQYERLLGILGRLGALRTMEDVARDVALASAV